MYYPIVDQVIQTITVSCLSAIFKERGISQKKKINYLKLTYIFVVSNDTFSLVYHPSSLSCNQLTYTTDCINTVLYNLFNKQIK